MPRYAKAGRPSPIDDMTRDVIREMLGRGDRQGDVAYWFRVSPSTINAIKKRYGPRTPTLAIPPPGPYLLVQQGEYTELKGTVVACGARIEQLRVYEQIVAELTTLVAKYREMLPRTDTSGVISSELKS